MIANPQKADYQASWKIRCPTDADKDIGTEFATSKKTGDNQVEINYLSYEACGGDYNKFLQFFKDSRYMNFGFLLIAIPLAFFGLKFIKVSLSVIGFVSGALLTSLVSASLFNFSNWSTNQWIIFSLVCLTVSSLVALLAYHSPSISIMIGAGALGYFGGIQLIMIASNLFHTVIEEMYKGGILVLCILFGIYLGCKLKKAIIILTTSTAGSFLLLFGIGNLLGNYPDFDLVGRQIINKSSNKLIPWIYIVGTLVLIVISASFQFVRYSKKNEEPESTFNQDNSQALAKSDDYTGYY